MVKISLIVFAVLLTSQLNLIQFVMGAPAPEGEAATTAASANPVGGILPVTLPTAILGIDQIASNLTAISDLIPATSSNPLSVLGSVTNGTGSIPQQIGGAVGTIKPLPLPNLLVRKSPLGESLIESLPIGLPTGQPAAGQQPTTAQPPAAAA